MSDTVVYLRISKELKEALQKKAKHLGLNLTSYIRMVLSKDASGNYR